MLDPNAPTIEEEDAEDAHEAIIECYNFLRSPEQTFSGFVTKRITNCVTELVDYQPLKLKQFEGEECLEFPLFSTAIDHYYSQLQTQKTEQKMIQAEKQALKKLENVKLDHLKRLENLKTSQETNVTKAQLIEMNLGLVFLRYR
jgi:predicted ribosome quality control (RQC) complex YloA/Tae2 family protein